MGASIGEVVNVDAQDADACGVQVVRASRSTNGHVDAEGGGGDGEHAHAQGGGGTSEWLAGKPSASLKYNARFKSRDEVFATSRG